VTLTWNRYGKARVRLVHVDRSRDMHAVRDLTVDVQLEGDFAPVYVDGDNATCLATDTMKNTVYAFAREHGIASPEAFAATLAERFATQPPVTRAIVSIVEHAWQRLAVDAVPQRHAFIQPGGEEWTTVITRDGDRQSIRSGIRNMVVMKTTDSSFAGFPRDKYTTLPETDDRILATAVTATWLYRDSVTDFEARHQIRTRLLDAFASHDSRSVQHTLHAMATAALDGCEAIVEITLSLPNRHHLLVDLKPFGLDNPNEVFVATEQPYGLIEATVRR
jgi:urate oxidase